MRSRTTVQSKTVVAPGGPGGRRGRQGQRRGALAKAMRLLSPTWTEQHHVTIEKVWTRIPDALKKLVVTLAVFSVGLAMSGDWVLLMVHLQRQMGLNVPATQGKPSSSFGEYLSVQFQGLAYFWIVSSVISYGVYLSVGGFLHWYFYVRQRHNAAEWKIQPNSWLSTELELDEIKWGCVSLLVTSTFTAFVSCWIYNDGWSMVYHKWDEYGIPWFLLQWPVIFLFQDYATYWIHRIYHFPWLYKRFHKLHHAYKHPTAFSVTAIHPVEVLNIQMLLSIPLFAFPVHWLPFQVIMLYTYYHGIIDHSGINFKAYWWQPWQPDAIFHDNHHQYFHVNFGFNCFFWDILHGTARRKDRLYTENTFFGTGKALTEGTAAEVAQDLLERTLENPKAYRNNTLEFALSKDELNNIKNKGKDKET